MSDRRKIVRDVALRNQDPKLEFTRTEVDREEYTLRSADGSMCATYSHPIYEDKISLPPSKKNLSEIRLGDLVEVTIDGGTYSGVVFLLSTYMGVDCLGDEKLFRIDDCQFIKRIK